jgi:MOSC domain-containing protein YiiM
MAQLGKEAYGPEGDAARHRPLAELEASLRALPSAPTDAGRVALVVRRRPDGVRETPERVVLSPEEGVPGDGWSRRPPRDPEAQLAVMRRDVAALLANGQPITLFGDNLLVDLDLSAPNLPLGTRLRVGGALVAVTAKPHNGCLKFKGRFGEDALRLVQAPATRPLNLRGIYWRVVEAGEAAVGDPIQVISRPC